MGLAFEMLYNSGNLRSAELIFMNIKLSKRLMLAKIYWPREECHIFLTMAAQEFFTCEKDRSRGENLSV